MIAAERDAGSARLGAGSEHPYRGLAELDYPFHDRVVTVTHCGWICFDYRKINLSVAFVGQNVCIKQIEYRL